jgi:hypothetical protein
MKTIECVALIYRSTKYLDFIVDQMQRYCQNFGDIKVTFSLVGNNPTDAIRSALDANKRTFKSSIFESGGHAHYMNGVYLAWNYAGMTVDADYICFLNSDFGFSPGWLPNLFKNWSPTQVVTSRLVESGKMESGQYGISHYFGHHPSNYREREFLDFAEKVKLENKIAFGGLYMPLLIEKNLFVRTGGFPPGNIFQNGVGSGGVHRMSGDEYFFQEVLKKQWGVQHVTALDSIVYHFQEGERSE